MHELSIAMSILDVASETAEREAAERVRAVHLRLGPLSGVVREALLSAWELAREGMPRLEESRLVIEDVPVVIRCAECAGERPAVSVARLVCSSCGAPAEGVVSGRDLEVTAMEIES